MTKLALAAALFAGACLSGCVSIPGVTQPIPGRSSAETSAICENIRIALTQPERYPGAYAAQRDAWKGNGCPGDPPG